MRHRDWISELKQPVIHRNALAPIVLSGPALHRARMSTFLAGMLGGILAWFATSFIAAPLSSFFALRHQATRLLLQRAWTHQEMSGDGFSSSGDELRRCGDDLRAWAITNRLACRVVKSFGLDPYKAGAALHDVANGREAYGDAASALKADDWIF